MEITNDSYEREETFRLKVILALSSAYPVSSSSEELVSFLADMNIETTPGEIESVLTSLKEESIVVSDEEGWMLKGDSDTLIAIAKPFLENEDTYTFMHSPFVKVIANLELFLNRAPLFKESLASMPTDLHIYLGMTDSSGSIDEVYNSIMDQIETLGTQPEFLYWFLYPNDMVSRLVSVYKEYGPAGLDKAFGNEGE